MWKSFCLVALLAQLAMGTARYVAPSGSTSNAGTISSPWRYVTNAVSRALPGDTIYVRAGDYRSEGTISPTASGQAGMPIVLRPYGNEVAKVLNFRLEEGRNFWVYKGWDCQGSSGDGVRVTGTHALGCLTIDSCNFSHHKDNGIDLGGPDFGGITVTNCLLNYNGEVNGQPSNSGEGSGIVIYGTKGKLWAHYNTICRNYAKGISYASSTNAVNCDSSVITHNLVYDNLETGIDWEASRSFVMYNYIDHNGIRDPEAGEWGDTGLSVHSACVGSLFAFNVVRSSGQMELSPRSSGSWYYNNTFVKDIYYTVVPGSPYASCILQYSGDGSNIFKNNLVVNVLSQPMQHFTVASGSKAVYQSQTWSNNMYWSPNATSSAPANKPIKIFGDNYYTMAEAQTSLGEEQGSLYANPAFTDTLMHTGSNFPGKDKGVNVGLPFTGLAPDMGAGEFVGGYGVGGGSAIIPPPPPPPPTAPWKVNVLVNKPDTVRLELTK